MSLGGDEFRIFLHCYLEPSPKNQALFRCIACDHFADGLCHRQMSWEITKNRDNTCYLRWSEEVFANSRTALWPTFASLKKLQFCPCQISFHLFFVKAMPIYSWIVKCHCLWKTQLAEHLSIFPGQSEYLPLGEPSVTGHSPLWDSPWCCCHGFSNTQQRSRTQTPLQIALAPLTIVGFLGLISSFCTWYLGDFGQVIYICCLCFPNL